MSEYITIDVEPSDAPNNVVIHTNLNLAPDGPEVYPDAASGEEGSPLAQVLFAVDSILALTIEGGDLSIEHAHEVELFVLVDEINAALKDFFL